MERRLPNGTVTESATEYVDAWRDLAEPFERLLGWRHYAYDPGLSFFCDTGARNQDVTTEVAMLVYALDSECRSLRAELAKAKGE